MQNFIVEFKDVLPPETCKHLIQKFENDSNQCLGRIGSGVDINKKNSTDLHISTIESWNEEVAKLNSLMLQALTQYIRAYPHMLVGAISPKFSDAKSGKLRDISPEDVQNMPNDMLANVINSVFCFDNINLQKYTKEQGNFNHWHSEQYPHPNDKSQKSLHRVLLWLIYLNDVETGGETEFLYQQAKVKPTTGSLILSPCGFTHTHRGTTPISNDKYVLASWISYRSSAQLYGKN